MELQYLAEFIEIAHLFPRELLHVSAPTRFDGNKAFRLQAIQRFPNRGFAYTQLICKLLFGQPPAFAKRTVQDLFFNAPVGEFCQIWNVCQFFHMSRWSRTRAVEPMTWRSQKFIAFNSLRVYYVSRSMKSTRQVEEVFTTRRICCCLMPGCCS